MDEGTWNSTSIPTSIPTSQLSRTVLLTTELDNHRLGILENV